MAGNRIRLVTDRPRSVVDVNPPSVHSVNMAGVTVEYYRAPRQGQCAVQVPAASMTALIFSSMVGRSSVIVPQTAS